MLLLLYLLQPLPKFQHVRILSLRRGAFFNRPRTAFMVSRKRTRSEVDAPPEQPQEEPGLLTQLRNCWEFANLMQYIAIFGKLMKIDEDFGIEVRAASL